MMDLEPPRKKSGNIPPRVGGMVMLAWGLFSAFFGAVVLCTSPIAMMSGEELATIVLAVLLACIHIVVGGLNVMAGIQLRYTNYPGMLSWLALLSNFGTCLFCGWIPVLVMSIAAASFLGAKRETPF